MKRLQYLRFCFLLVVLACSDKKENKTETAVQADAPNQSKILNEVNDEQGEPIAIGLAINDPVFVYADTTKHAAIIETLGIADHVWVIGVKNMHNINMPEFVSHGWLRIEKKLGRQGWARQANLALIERVAIKIFPRDSLFQEPALNSPLVPAFVEPSMFGITERVVNDGRVWLGSSWRDQNNDRVGRWLLSRSNSYHGLQDAYGRIILHYLGVEAEDLSAPDLEDEQAHRLTWEIISRLKPLLAPADTIYFTGYDEPAGTEVFISYAKSKIYRQRKQYDEAITELQAIIKHSPEQVLFYGRSGMEARLQLAELHAEQGDTNRAIEQYHIIISHYPDESRSSGEWAGRGDYLAAQTIHQFLAHDAARLYRESDRILAKSQSPAVKLLGYAGKVRSLGLQGLRQQMVDTAIVAVARYPEVKRFVTEETINYTNLIIASGFAVLEQQADIAGFKQFAEQVQKRFPRHIIGTAATLCLARFLDKTDGTPAELEQLYAQVVDEKVHFYSTYSAFNLSLNSGMAAYRLERLKRFESVKAEIVRDAVELKKGAGKQFPGITKLALGERVEALYTDKVFLNHPDTPPQFAKVKRANGTIGWVKMDQIKTLDGSSIPDHTLR